LARWKQPRGQRARSSCSVLLNSQSRRRQGGTHQRKPATPDQLKLKTDAESLPRCAPLRAFLVGADHHRLGKDVSMHRLLQSGLVRTLEFRQDRIERIELVEVAVAAYRRGGAAPNGAGPQDESVDG